MNVTTCLCYFGQKHSASTFKANCSVSEGVFDQFGWKFFVSSQDSQDSDDESKYLCKNKSTQRYFTSKTKLLK